MDNRLINYLVKFEISKDDPKPVTHTSKIKPFRRYHIDNDNIEAFYDNYNQVIWEGGIAGLTEMPEPVVPLIVDIDFKCTTDSGIKRYYRPQHIRDIIQIYHEIIEEITENPTTKMFYCCVLEKKAPTLYQGKCKDGIHLHFPYYFTEHWLQKEYIRTQVIKRIEERQIFKDIPLVESVDKVFDKNIPNVAWLMYGSRKDQKAEAYVLTKLYNRDMDTMTLNGFFPKIGNQSRKWNLPRLLSIRQHQVAVPLRQGLELKQIKQCKMIHKEFSRDLTAIIEDLKEAEPLMEMLDHERADDFNTWMEIGWILYNISEGHQKGLDMWIQFSANSEKFTEGECEKKWSQMSIKNYTLASLKYIAQQDSPSEYSCWKDSKVKHILHQGITAAHNDIAKILHMLFENQYICADIDKEVWYEFKGHHWVINKKGINLRWHMSHTLANKYATLAQDYLAQLQNEQDQAQRSIYNQKAKDILNLINKLKNNTFKNAVMKEAMEYFYDEHFVERMDEKAHLLVFENGVYDSQNKIFRDGRPDDYCTKSTGRYYQEFSKDDPKYKELFEIFRKIFPDKEIFTFFQQTGCDIIRGGNRNKLFIIWNGDGDNGKSVAADFYQAGFGGYYYTPPTSILTGKLQQSSGATAELIPMKGAKIVVISETDNADILNCGMMKKLTSGGDPIYARGLFKDPVAIVPNFSTILHCNKLPAISAEDKASWNRIRVLPFSATFKKAHLVPATEKEQYEQKIFPMDKTLKNRIKDLADIFMWWLIKTYEEMGDQDLIEPPQVMEATNVYQKVNDFYLQFMDERIQETEDDKDFITLTQIYTLFKAWYKSSYPGRTYPTRIQVKEAFEKKLGKQVKGVWRRVKTYDPDEELAQEEE